MAIRKRKTNPKKYTVPDEVQCGYVKADGKPCKRPRTLNPNFGKKDEPRLQKHCNFHIKARPIYQEMDLLPGADFTLPPDLPLDSFTDLANVLADTLNRVRRGQLPPRIGQTVATIANPLIKALIAREKLDPAREAKRQITIEELRRRAQALTPEEATRIAAERDAFLIEDITTEALAEEEIKAIEDKTKTQGIKGKGSKKFKKKISDMKHLVDKNINFIQGEFIDDVEYSADEEEGTESGEELT